MQEHKPPTASAPDAPGLHPLHGRSALAVVLFCALLYVPCAGSYGLWDPWETHYGEVARTMLQRGDFLTTYWQDEVFKSKPVLTFWMQALGMAAFGLNRDGGSSGEMALSSAAEWGMRLPFVLVSIFALFAIFLLVSRVAGRRAGMLSALVCATAPQYALISRQSITDIPFVALMSAGLCLFLLGLLVDKDEEPAALRLRIGARSLTITAWHLLSGLFLLVVLPQLGLLIFDIGWQHERGILLGRSMRLQLWGLPHALPWLALLVFYLLSFRHRGPRRAYQVYILGAWLLCGLAVLAKGLGGLFIPVAVVGLFLALVRDAGLLGRLEALRGVAVLLLVAAPWHHAMWIRHGDSFWSEYFGHHHFKRAQMGVHGERGTFEYFIHQLGIGMFPWTALVPAALLRFVRSARPSADPRARLALFALVWAVVGFSLFAIMETKFHHYALPAIPPLAILVGLWLDELMEDRRAGTFFLVAAALGLALILARDLYRDPAHLVLMFIYKYDRLFPYELNFEVWILALSVPMVVAIGALAFPAARRMAIYGLGGGATLFTLFTLNHYLVELSPHWGQKNLHVIYHQSRSGPEERLIAWQLNWRGENFYSKNQVVVHMQPKDTPEFKAYLQRHAGKRFYLIMEQGRLGSLKTILSQVGAADRLELVGPGGQSWPDNWIPHFREERAKVLFRERAKLSATCRRFKEALSALPVPAAAAASRGTAMADTWWGGHCHRFSLAEREAHERRCQKGAKEYREDCAEERARIQANAELCRRARRALGPYPYKECFDLYPNNKFLLVRFVP